MDTGEIENILSLTPTQIGILFHTFEQRQGVYVDQLVCEIIDIETLRVDEFRRACSLLMKRHGVLRSTFQARKKGQPVQVILKESIFLFELFDWRDSEAAIDRRIEERFSLWSWQERKNGVDVEKSPLIRFNLIRTTDTHWYFAVTYHHLILDAWSVRLLFADLAGIYQSLCNGESPPAWMGKNNVEYLSSLADRELVSSQQFWSDQMQGLQTATQLGIHVEKTATEDITTPDKEIRFSVTDTEEIKRAARNNRVTLFALVQAAWSFLLYRYSGETKVVSGVTFAGRPADLTGADYLVGMFINTLPVPAEINTQACIGDWLQGMHKHLADIRRHEFTPLPKIKSWSEFSNTEPLFHSVLTFENVPGLDRGATTNVIGERFHIGESNYIFSANFPINVYVVPGPQLSLRINYDTSIYNASAIDRVLSYFYTLINEFATFPEKVLSEINGLNQQQWQSQLVEYNQTQRAFPDNCGIHHAFEAYALKNPTQTALSIAGIHWDYRTLSRRANALAWQLREMGVGPEVPVAICAERSLSMIVGVLAILKSGGIYVPLDPSYPKQRLAIMLDIAKPQLVLYQRKLNALLPNKGITTFELENSSGERDDAPDSHVFASNGAYIIFTSGSSGTPKGIILAHKGLCNMIHDWNRLFNVNEGDHILQFASFSFDASVWEIFMAFSSGASLCVGSRNTLYSSEELLELLQSLKISHALLPPSLLGVLTPRKLKHLRSLAAIGERCTEKIERCWRRGLRFYNAYGPAEATITAAVYESTHDELFSSGPPIGKPMANTQLYVLDSDLQPVPQGCAGELFIGGVGVARSYIGIAGGTAEKFLPNPFDTNVSGARFYRSGDLVWQDENGDLHYIGRIDQQVKIRGVRVELGEIESRLRQIHEVQDALVITDEAGPGQAGYQLLAYVIGDEEQLPVKTIRARLKEHLPDAMLPSSYIYLNAFPVTANGKIDRSGLPKDTSEHVAKVNLYRAPRNSVERTLVEIWSDVLQRQTVGIDDNYFDLGGDSISAIRIIVLAKRKHLLFTSRQLMENDTIAELARVVKEQKYEQVVPNSDQTQNGSAPLPFDPTPIQRWFFSQYKESWQRKAAIHHYNQSVAVDFKSEISDERLRRAISLLQRYHATLRLRVMFGQDEPLLEYAAKDTPIVYEMLDFNADDTQNSNRFRDDLEQFHQSLNIEHGPVFKALRVNVTDKRYRYTRLILVAHHLAVDAVSWQIILENLNRVLMLDSPSETNLIQNQETTFDAWSNAVKEHTQVDDFSDDMRYWSGLNPQPLLAIRKIDSHQLVSAETRSLRLDKTLSQILIQQAGSKYGLGDILLMVLSGLLQEEFNEKQVPIDMEYHGRDNHGLDVDLTNTVGWFTCIVPFKLAPYDPYHPMQCAVETNSLRKIWQERCFNFFSVKYSPYVDGEFKKVIDNVKSSPVLFNFSGNREAFLSSIEVFTPSQTDVGALRSSRRFWPYTLEINAYVREQRIETRWEYPAGGDQREVFKRLPDQYHAILEKTAKFLQINGNDYE
jgi:amino acid adenylation domain-containing protein